MTIRFRATLETIGFQTIVRMPKSASRKLPSRGLSFVEGTFNQRPFQTTLEPDGKGSHWFKVGRAISKAGHLVAGDTVVVEIAPSDRWPEPDLPADLKQALAGNADVRAVWTDITPLARWDWIRWIGATRNPETRAIRIDKTLSKLRSGKRAACCFDRSQCTDVTVSRSGVLLGPGSKNRTPKSA